MKKIIFILLILSMTSCLQRRLNKTLGSWIGSTKQELIMSWGYPTKTTSDGGDGEILAYANRVSYSVSAGNYVDYWDYKLMYVNKSGIIYHWVYKRNPNPPERIDLRIFNY